MSADTLRAADLPTLAAALNDQRTRSVDVVVPASKLRVTLGAVDIQGCDPVMSDDGVTDVNGFYVPTRAGDEGIAAKLAIPGAYLRRCRADNIGLYDDNVNGWLAWRAAADHRPDTVDPDDIATPRAAVESKFLLRLLMHPKGNQVDGQAGVLRAFLSDSYRTIDHFDVLLAALQGIRDAGVTDPIIDADLTDRRMIVRVSTPDVAVLAPKLLENYRSPFGGHDAGGVWTPERVANASRGEGQAIEGGGETVFGGFVISNSETGGGSFSITPRLVVKVCNNGLTITAEALKRVHLGGKLEEGTVKWSDETTHRNLALVASQAKDAVRAFLSPEFLSDQVAKLEAVAGEPIGDAQAVITTVSKKLGFTEADAALILGHFIKGGQMTAGGVMQAVTSAAQTIDDGDRAWEMELQGIAAMHEAVAAVRTLARV